MELGLLKSKIENKLSKSYSDNSFKKEIKNFKKYVLENSEIKKAYYIYDELSKEKGFEKGFAEDFLNECIDLYRTIKISKKDISLLENWVKSETCDNHYKDVDNVLNGGNFIIENILNSKKNIVNRLITKKETNGSVNLPLNKVLEVANVTLKNYLETLSESEFLLINKYKTLSEIEVKNRYDVGVDCHNFTPVTLSQIIGE
jgi:hypothetical protein